MKRRTWFVLHSLAGFKLTVLLSFVLVTGTLATISPEIDWVFDADARVFSVETTAPAAWGKLLANARAAYPDSDLQTIQFSDAPWLAVRVVALDGKQERFLIYLHPETGEVLGDGPWFNWQRFLRLTHRHLMLPVPLGVTIVGLLSIPLLVSMFSGLNIYKRWWTGFLRLPAAQVARGAGQTAPISAAFGTAKGPSPKTRRRYWGAWHRLAGLWCLWFVLLMAITGIWYVLEQWGLNISYEPPPASQTGVSASKLTPAQLDALVADSAVAFPALRVTQILLNTPGSDALVLQGQAEALLVRPRANAVAYDVGSGKRLALKDARDGSLHLRISEAADPLHFGTFGGWPTRLLWFFFGTLMSGMAVSGAYLLGLRLLAGERQSGGASAWRRAWSALEKPFRWPTAALVLLCLGLSILAAQGFSY